MFYLWDGAPAALWGCGLLAVSPPPACWRPTRCESTAEKASFLPSSAITSRYWGFSSTPVFSPAARYGCPSCPWVSAFSRFQQIWYLREVYAGTFSHKSPPGRYLTYSFFSLNPPFAHPEATELLQLREVAPQRDTAAGLYAIGLGHCRKVLLADNLGVLVNNGWAARPDGHHRLVRDLGYTFSCTSNFRLPATLPPAAPGCWDCGCPSTSTLPTGAFPLRSSGNAGT